MHLSCCSATGGSPRVTNGERGSSVPGSSGARNATNDASTQQKKAELEPSCGRPGRRVHLVSTREAVQSVRVVQFVETAKDRSRRGAGPTGPPRGSPGSRPSTTCHAAGGVRPRSSSPLGESDDHIRSGDLPAAVLAALDEVESELTTVEAAPDPAERRSPTRCGRSLRQVHDPLSGPAGPARDPRLVHAPGTAADRAGAPARRPRLLSPGRAAAEPPWSRRPAPRPGPPRHHRADQASPTRRTRPPRGEEVMSRPVRSPPPAASLPSPRRGAAGTAAPVRRRPDPGDLGQALARRHRRRVSKRSPGRCPRPRPGGRWRSSTSPSPSWSPGSAPTPVPGDPRRAREPGGRGRPGRAAGSERPVRAPAGPSRPASRLTAVDGILRPVRGRRRHGVGPCRPSPIPPR